MVCVLRGMAFLGVAKAQAAICGPMGDGPSAGPSLPKRHSRRDGPQSSGIAVAETPPPMSHFLD